MKTEKPQKTAPPPPRLIVRHRSTLADALTLAMEQCLVWREVGSRKPFSAKELYLFALWHDEEHPLTGHQYYMVTREGAIGISPGLEWLTTWMFVPMEDCRERDFIMLKMRDELKEELALRKTEEPMQPSEELHSAQPPQPPTVVPQPPKPKAVTLRFCTNCGAKIVPGNKFCIQCGTRLQ